MLFLQTKGNFLRCFIVFSIERNSSRQWLGEMSFLVWLTSLLSFNDSKENFRKFEVNVFSGEFLVDRLEGGNLKREGSMWTGHRRTRRDLILDEGLLISVEMDLEETRSVEFNSNAFARDLCWIDEIVQNGIMNSSQCTARRWGWGVSREGRRTVKVTDFRGRFCFEWVFDFRVGLGRIRR